MGQFEKQVQRLKSVPSDYTFREAQTLLEHLGFVLFNKGKTAGSRVKFVRKSDMMSTCIHKPHPGDIMKEYQVKDLLKFLRNIGEIE